MALGIWSSQVIGIAAEPLAFPIGYDGLGTLGVWTAALVASLAGLGAVSGRVATPGRVAFGAFALGIGAVGTHALSLAPIGLNPGIDWQLLPFVAAFAGAAGGCMAALGAFFRGGDRTRPATPGWQATSALVFAISLVASQQLVLGAAGIGEQVGSTHFDRLTSSTLTLFASIGSCAILLIGLLFSVLEARMRRTLRRAETELQRRSFRDGLTGLPNRLMFDGMLAQAVQQAHSARHKLAVLFIDLDGFKPVNESLGHVAGDLLLREIAARLKRFARPEDRVAHLGGDEFLMLVGADPSAEDLGVFAERLMVSIGEPCQMNGKEATVSSSIGIALYPEHGADRRPDRQRRGGDALGQEQRRRQLRLLRAAHDERRARPARAAARPAPGARATASCELFYQPKIHAPSGEITGAEALMRWDHPERGLVGPTVFIPMAERFGLIGAIGNWVIDEACRQAGQWRDEGLRMRVAINLSAHQLRHPDLARPHRRGAAPHRDQAAAADLRDHRVGGDGRHRRTRSGWSSSWPASACTSRSTTSAPATRACPTCASCAPTS